MSETLDQVSRQLAILAQRVQSLQQGQLDELGTDGVLTEFLHGVPDELSDGGSVDNYAFRTRQSDALEVTVTAGNAYMVNETAEAIAETALAVPPTAGTYVVYLRHTYGFGAAEGTWGALTVEEVSAVPSELDSGRVVARNFIISTITVADEAITDLVQNWRLGDIQGYAPYFAPEEGP